MRTVTVYRVDYVKKARVPIGEVQERRKKDRGGNLLGLLRLARKTYGTDPDDAIHIASTSVSTAGLDGASGGITPRTDEEERNTLQRIEEYSSGGFFQPRQPLSAVYVTI